MADITALKNSNTFEEQMTTINSIITKLNTIEANASTMLMAFSATPPADASVTSNTAMLYVDNSGNFKIKKNVGGVITSHAVTIGSDTGE